MERQAARVEGREAEREKGLRREGREGGFCPAAENVISRLGGETNSCCQADLVKAVEEPECN